MRLLAASIILLLSAFSLAHASYSCAELDDKIKADLKTAKYLDKKADEAMRNENETAYNRWIEAHHTFINQAANWSTIFLARCS